MMSKIKLIAIIGPSGSGKDTLLRKVLHHAPSLNRVVNCTTRPKRWGEKEGIDYFYLTPEQFAEKLLNGSIIEASSFNDWFYGTEISALNKEKINIGIFNPEAIESLLLYKDKIDLYIYCLTVKDTIRLIRQLSREKIPDIDEIFRRYKTDRVDFYDLSFEYTTLKNETKKQLKENIHTIIHDIKFMV